MSSKTILVVDDNQAEHFLAGIVIEEFDSDISLLHAYNGKEALEILEGLKEPPDAIFLDIIMPVMNGLEFLAAYNQKASPVANVIVMTTLMHEGDIDSVLAYPFVKGIYDKPIDVEDLLFALGHNENDKPKASPCTQLNIFK